MEGLSEEERKALRGSKFAPLPPPPPSCSRSQQSRLAHPGGPLTTNKAAALAKFLERKLQDPNGLSSLNPDLIELAVKNAKDTVNASGTLNNSGRTIRHVTSFGDSEDISEEGKVENSVLKKQKKNKKKKKQKKNKKQKMVDVEYTTLQRPNKKFKF